MLLRSHALAQGHLIRLLHFSCLITEDFLSAHTDKQKKAIGHVPCAGLVADVHLALLIILRRKGRESDWLTLKRA